MSVVVDLTYSNDSEILNDGENLVSQRRSNSIESKSAHRLKRPLTEQDLLNSGWRRESSDYLPRNKRQDDIGDIIFVPPWGVPPESTLSREDLTKLWELSIRDVHYFNCYLEGVVFVTSLCGGDASKCPDGVRSLRNYIAISPKLRVNEPSATFNEKSSIFKPTNTKLVADDGLPLNLYHTILNTPSRSENKKEQFESSCTMTKVPSALPTTLQTRKTPLMKSIGNEDQVNQSCETITFLNLELGKDSVRSVENLNFNIDHTIEAPNNSILFSQIDKSTKGGVNSLASLIANSRNSCHQSPSRRTGDNPILHGSVKRPTVYSSPSNASVDDSVRNRPSRNRRSTHRFEPGQVTSVEEEYGLGGIKFNKIWSFLKQEYGWTQLHINNSCQLYKRHNYECVYFTKEGTALYKEAIKRKQQKAYDSLTLNENYFLYPSDIQTYLENEGTILKQIESYLVELISIDESIRKKQRLSSEMAATSSTLEQTDQSDPSRSTIVAQAVVVDESNATMVDTGPHSSSLIMNRLKRPIVTMNESEAQDGISANLEENNNMDNTTQVEKSSGDAARILTAQDIANKKSLSTESTFSRENSQNMDSLVSYESKQSLSAFNNTSYDTFRKYRDKILIKNNQDTQESDEDSFTTCQRVRYCKQLLVVCSNAKIQQTWLNVSHKCSLWNRLSSKDLRVRGIIQSHIDSVQDSFTISKVWDKLKEAGWSHGSSIFLSAPKYDTLYVAPWAREQYEEWRKTSDKSHMSELIEGRDYFFENIDVETYLKKFGFYFDPKGIQIDNSLSRRSRASINMKDFYCSKESSREPLIRLSNEENREKELLKWLKNGHCFNEEGNHPYVGLLIRRFIVTINSKSSLQYTKQYYDGVCVSYRSSIVKSLSEDMNEEEMNTSRSVRGEWGVVYDNIAAFGSGCELLDIIDIHTAIENYQTNRLQYPVLLTHNDARIDQYLNIDDLHRDCHKEISKLKSTQDHELRTIQDFYERKFEQMNKLQANSEEFNELENKYKREKEELTNQLNKVTRQANLNMKEKNKIIEELKESHRDELSKLRNDLTSRFEMNMQLREKEYRRELGEMEESLRQSRSIATRRGKGNRDDYHRSLNLSSPSNSKLPTSYGNKIEMLFTIDMKMEILNDMIQVLASTMKKKGSPPDEIPR